MSNRYHLVFAFAALTLPLSLGACASTPKPVAIAQPVEMYAPPPPPPPAEIEIAQYGASYGASSYHGGQRTEILSQLPDNAPPGECYARVKVPGTGMAALPQAPGARWVQNPGPPGSPGPIWCLEPTGPAPVAFEPEQYGFIRVLCDDDVTPGRIVNIQQKLHEGGYYQGGYTGRYDAATAQAVTRFQGAHRLNHGGYLSVDTVRQIEGPTTVVVAPRITVSPKITVTQPQAPAYPQPPVYQQPIYAPPIMQPPMMQPPQMPPMYPQPIMAPPVLYPQAGYASYQTSYGGAVAASASASASAGAGVGVGVGMGGYAAPYYGTSGYAGYGDGWWAGPGYPGGAGSYPQLPYPLPYQNYGPGPAAWPAPGFGPQGYPRPAYNAPRSAVQSGWLNWSGKSYF